MTVGVLPGEALSVIVGERGGDATVSNDDDANQGGVPGTGGPNGAGTGGTSRPTLAAGAGAVAARRS